MKFYISLYKKMPEEITLQSPIKKFGGLNLTKGFKYESQDISSYDNVKTTTSDLDREVEKNLKITLPTGELDKQAERDFVSSLDDDSIMTLGSLIQQGYSYKAAKALYENRDKYKDITAEGISKYERQHGTFYNSVGGLTESILGIPKFAGKIGADLAEGSIKLLGGDEERAKAAGDKVRGFIDKIGFGDEESSAYQNANLAGDFGQLFIPGGQYKAPTILAKFPKFTNVLTKVAKNAEKYPKLMSLLKLGGQGAVDTVKYNAINQEYTDPIEMGAGGLLNLVFGKGGEVVGKVSDKLGLSGIMSSGKIKKVIEAIDKEGGTLDDAAGRFNSRGFKGSKDEIVAQITKHADDAKALKDELLSTVGDRFESQEATKILDALIDSKTGIAGQEELLATLKSMQRADNKYTLSEMEEIMRQLDRSPLNPYKPNQTAETKANEEAIGRGNMRNAVKTKVENVADELGLGNIKALNNEIVVSNKFIDGIKNKSIGEQIKEGLAAAGPFAAPAAIYGYIKNGDLGGALRYGFGAYLLSSTRVRTYLSNKLHSLSGKGKVSLTKRLGSNGQTALSNAGSKTLNRILESADDGIWSDISNSITNWIGNLGKKGAVVGGAKGTSELVDMISE